ncbi:MAG: esterase family protein [Flavobacteriaceae bacterium]|nr:esterase family protein [Flavobacteriaceae bacterium]
MLLLFVSSLSFAQSRGKVLTQLKYESSILKESVNYAVYLPKGYFVDSLKTYPVFYLLHGYTDNETAWIEKGWVDIAADQEVILGNIEEMIIVMPDGGLNWYVNHPEGNFNYENMFTTEFIPFIDNTYRTKNKRKYRAIGGLSMGGFGALGYVMRHPQLFSTCVAFSAAIRPDDEIITKSQEEFDRLYAPVYGKEVKGKNRISKHWNSNNPIYLAKSLPVEQLKSINWYITCGDDDYLFYGNSALHKIFRDRKISHEYRVADGGHNWIYWRTYISDGLVFLSKHFMN